MESGVVWFNHVMKQESSGIFLLLSDGEPKSVDVDALASRNHFLFSIICSPDRVTGQYLVFYLRL